MSKFITKKQCYGWEKNKNVNPISGRRIKKFGTLYNKIKKECNIKRQVKKVKSKKLNKNNKSKPSIKINKKKKRSAKKKRRMSVVQLIKQLKLDLGKTIKKMTINDFSRVIKYANEKYHSGNKPVLSDEVYDIIKETLEKKDPANIVLQEVGAPIKGKKVKLPYQLGSMDKIKPDTNVVDRWKKKYTGPYVISDKLDGISALYVEKRNGSKITKNLYTRGNGTYGQDISSLLKYLDISSNILTKIDKNEISIRGELILSKKNFKKYEKDFSNARNTVAGIANSKTIKRPDIAKLISFVSYEIIMPVMKPSDQMLMLNKLGLNTVVNHKTNKISNEILSTILQKNRDNSQYEIDGIIVTNDDIYKRVVSGNPKHAFAFKMVLSGQMAEVKVIDVEWSPSKHGLLKPRVIIETVNLGGVNIRCATGYNGKYIVDNKIGPGTIVKIIRSGDVIPKIIEIIKSTKAKMPLSKYIWNKSKVDIILDDFENSSIVNIKIIVNFMKKLDINYISDGLVKKLYENGLNTLKKILTASINQFLEIEGIKIRMAKKIYYEIHHKIENVPLEVLMGASNMFGIGFGRKKCKFILDKYPNILELKGGNALVEKLEKIDGLANITAKKFVVALPKFKQFLNEHSGVITYKVNKVKKIISGKLSGYVYVFTGFRDKELEKKIESLGGEISNTVSKNKNIIVVKKNIDSPKSSKENKAIKLGKKIITLSELNL